MRILIFRLCHKKKRKKMKNEKHHEVCSKNNNNKKRGHEKGVPLVSEYFVQWQHYNRGGCILT